MASLGSASTPFSFSRSNPERAEVAEHSRRYLFNEVYRERNQSVAKVQFRWKYAVSAFLVCGVLSLTIGSPDKPVDPLVVEANALVARYNKFFKVNKDPLTASEAMLDGPEEKTFVLDHPEFNQLILAVYRFGTKVSNASFTRAKDAAFSTESESNKGVAAAALEYAKLQIRIYGNLMRLAHDAKFKTNQATNAGMNFLNNLGALGGEKGEIENLRVWNALNAENVKATGARAFSPNAYDFLNIQLGSQTATLILSDRNAQKKMNLRWVKDAQGNYTRVELFMNDFEKQMAEYAALVTPKDKPEYLKLLQFAAVREGMSNRWALRRMLPQSSYSERSVNFCAKDLVSFRTPKSSLIGQIGAYDSLWQEDRFTDVIELGQVAAANATLGRPLLTSEQLTKVVFLYLSHFDSFSTGALLTFKGHEDQLESILKSDYAEMIRNREEEIWSVVDPDKKSNYALDIYMRSSFPADDLSKKAIAERYTQFAFRIRREALINALTFRMQQEQDLDKQNGQYLYLDGKGQPTTTVTKTPKFRFPEAFDPAMMKRAVELVDEALAKTAENWKKTQQAAVLTALEQSLGSDWTDGRGRLYETGHTKNQNPSRFADFLKQVEPTAKSGSQGVRVQQEVIAASKKLATSLTVKPPLICADGTTPGMRSAPSAGTCRNKAAYLKDVKARIGDPHLYIGHAPFRVLAVEAGVNAQLRPSTPEQLSTYFYKKLDLVSHVKTKPDAPYSEQLIAQEISSNRAVMNGMDLLFAEISGEYQKRAGDNPQSLDEATRVKHLEASIIPGTKSAFQKFSAGMSDPGKFKNQQRADKRVSEIGEKLKADLKPKVTSETTRTEKPVFFAPKSWGRPDEVAEVKKAKADKIQASEMARRKNGYIRVMQNHSLDWTGGDYYVEDAKQRQATSVLFAQAIALLGVSEEAVGAKPKLNTANTTKGSFSASVSRWFSIESTSTVKEKTPNSSLFDSYRSDVWYLPEHVNSWVANEQLIKKLLPKAGILDRLSATLIDQQALGQVFEQESLATQPILGIQPTWKRETEEIEPTLLYRLARKWNPKAGWSSKYFEDTFRWITHQAAENDVGKVETYCLADIKNYETDENFKFMFNSISGIRKAFSSNAKVQAWDDEIAKESRTWQQAMMDDYIDPYSMAIFYAMILVVAWQIALPAVITALNGSALAAFFSGTGSLAAQLCAGFGKLTFLAIVGNVSPLMMVFSLQTYLLLDTHAYRLPPQLNFTYQVANSRFQDLTLPKIASRPFTDRVGMKKLHDENAVGVFSQRNVAYMSIAGEVFQFHFAVSSIRKGLGYVGRRAFFRLSASSSEELRAAVGSGGLRDLVREKGVKAGTAEYLSKAKTMVTGLSRITSVKGTLQAKAGLSQMLGERLGTVVKDKSVLRTMYQTKFQETFHGLEYAKQELASFFPHLKGNPEALTDEMKDLYDLLEIVRHNLKNDGKITQGRGYATVVVSRKYDEFLRAQSKLGKNIELFRNTRKKNVAALVLASKIDAAKAEGRMYSKLLKNIDQVPSVPGESETTAFFRSLSPSDMEMHRNIFNARTQFVDLATGKTAYAPILDKLQIKAIQKHYKDFDYLMEDWKIANPRAKAVGGLMRTGRPDFYVGDDQNLGQLNAADFSANPQNYRVYTLPLSTK